MAAEDEGSCICCNKRRARRGWDGAGPIYCERCDKLVNDQGMTHQRALQAIAEREERTVFDLFRGPRDG